MIMDTINEFIKDYYPTLSLLVAVVTIWLFQIIQPRL